MQRDTIVSCHHEYRRDLESTEESLVRDRNLGSDGAGTAFYMNDVAKENASREASFVSSMTVFTERDATSAGKIDAEFGDYSICHNRLAWLLFCRRQGLHTSRCRRVDTFTFSSSWQNGKDHSDGADAFASKSKCRQYSVLQLSSWSQHNIISKCGLKTARLLPLLT